MLIAEHERHIAHHEARIAELRKNCPHADVKIQSGSNTGNYDPAQDDYWYIITCKDCGHVQRVYESSNPIEYRHWARRSVEDDS